MVNVLPYAHAHVPELSLNKARQKYARSESVSRDTFQEGKVITTGCAKVAPAEESTYFSAMMGAFALADPLIEELSTWLKDKPVKTDPARARSELAGI